MSLAYFSGEEGVFTQTCSNDFLAPTGRGRGSQHPVPHIHRANLPPVLLTSVENLPPVSTTQGVLVDKFAAGVVDTGGKFAAGVVDTGGNLPPVSLTPVANLPPVSLTPVVQFDFRISPRNFEKIRNDPNVIIRGLGEGDS
jgi:hypothetical protein